MPYISSIPTLAPASRRADGKRVTSPEVSLDAPLEPQTPRLSFFLLKQGLNVPTMNKLRSNFKRLNISVQQIPSRYLRCLIEKYPGSSRGSSGANTKLGFHGDLLIFRLQECSPEFRKTLIHFLHKYMILPTSFLVDEISAESPMLGLAPSLREGANLTKEASSD